MRRLRILLLLITCTLVLAVAAWTLWSEQHPDQERELRIDVQERLHEWFPEAMALPEDQFGFLPAAGGLAEEEAPDVILLHGLDEPGGIWDELVTALDEAGFSALQFRYPNDQAIDRSADLLADYWPTLPADQPVVLVGHSMGGLVIRDFVSRRRHPARCEPDIEGPPVQGVVLVATPNQGSEWARLRVWLELREALSDIPEGRFSLFAGLRDGTGAAKIDLRPDSVFLEALNDRPWPDPVPVRVIGGRLSEPTPAMLESLGALSETLGTEDVARSLEHWWAQTGEGLGDGAVPVASLDLPGAPPPLILEASHRGLLVRTPLNQDTPPAIEPVLEIIEKWRANGPE